MDHRFIDDHSVAGRYLEHTLSPAQRAEFEAHLVDCQECTDRLLLAEMFQHRNGTSHPAQETPMRELAPLGLRDRFVRLFTSWQIFLILAVSAAALMLAAFSLLLWTIR
jgi:anti-sigma factor RsiW